MSIKYLVNLDNLSDKELDQYAEWMMDLQTAILDSIDIWTDNYNLIADEYLTRRSKRATIIKTESETRH
jgi:hypothetical protein